jgi:hypothetical protein
MSEKQLRSRLWVSVFILILALMIGAASIAFSQAILPDPNILITS